MRSPRAAATASGAAAAAKAEARAQFRADMHREPAQNRPAPRRQHDSGNYDTSHYGQEDHPNIWSDRWADKERIRALAEGREDTMLWVKRGANEKCDQINAHEGQNEVAVRVKSVEYGSHNGGLLL
jgi:hypothetical protein